MDFNENASGTLKSYTQVVCKACPKHKELERCLQKINKTSNADLVDELHRRNTAPGNNEPPRKESFKKFTFKLQ